MSEAQASTPSIRNPDHEDYIERLDRIFYIRWTAGPNYERAFLCIEDGEPDMHDLATMSYAQARIFAAAYRAAKGSSLLSTTPVQ